MLEGFLVILTPSYLFVGIKWQLICPFLEDMHIMIQKEENLGYSGKNVMYERGYFRHLNQY